MSEMVERVARALRSDPVDESELDKVRSECRAPGVAEKVVLDCRELVYFKEEHGWTPAEGVDIDQWLMASRVRAEALEMAAETGAATA